MVFSVMRNETYFLPFFLRYYRGIGIRQFWIYADRCNTETHEYLESQLDVTVLTGNLSFGETFDIDPRNRPRRLIHYLRDLAQQWLPDRWVLAVDADEFFILPPPAKTIGELIEALERSKQDFCFTPMVEFYPPTLAMRNYDSRLDPFAANRLFDCGPYHQFDLERGKVRHLKNKVTGVRARLFQYMMQSYPTEIEAIYDGSQQTPPGNYKVPLIRHGAGIVRAGSHGINKPLNLNLSAALAHFKFHPGLDEKIDLALSEKQYYRKSEEYRFLKLVIEKVPDFDLTSELSRTYSGPQSLVDSKLLSRLAEG